MLTVSFYVKFNDSNKLLKVSSYEGTGSLCTCTETIDTRSEKIKKKKQMTLSLGLFGCVGIKEISCKECKREIDPGEPLTIDVLCWIHQAMKE